MLPTLGPAQTIQANSGANPTLFITSLPIQRLFHCPLQPALFKSSQQDVDLPKFTEPGPSHIWRMKPSIPSNKDTMKLQPLTLTEFESLPETAIMLESPTPMLTLSNALSAVAVITITMQPHINDLMPTFAKPSSTMKNCHPSPNWKVIYSTLMNHEDSPYLRKINATSTSTLTLPANTFITTQVALPLNKISLRDNNKLSAQFFALLTNKTTVTDRTIDHLTDTRATNFQHQTVPTIITSTVEMLPLQDRIMELDHLNDQRPRTPTTNADRRIVQPRSGETHQQMLPTLYATIVEESVTMQDNTQQPTVLKTTTATEITYEQQQTTKTPLRETIVPIL